MVIIRGEMGCVCVEDGKGVINDAEKKLAPTMQYADDVLQSWTLETCTVFINQSHLNTSIKNYLQVSGYVLTILAVLVVLRSALFQRDGWLS